ncbi:sulfite exporter TauE/SafE family protein [Sporosalibacterium faouarense]|uniref:sulfite exporter TauE/SafE family protein n=1 Tax=Sporosalibacterium faouarense TaxID=516123 RepID=UPI00141CCDA2|nr:sulfite exporter TauE/SafE family protein [Sporosalibacterium faouarense]MTI47337.1 sulfite exporter TauE/SafE family protein [Bacillota bacterium]
MYQNMLLFILIGFVAQIIDGALGMAYGVSSTTMLLSMGTPPAVASASVHLAEVFTTLTSGISHLKLGNVDKKLLKKLVLPGIIGGVLGAYILTSIPTGVIKPIVAIYLLIMGIRILYKARKRIKNKESSYSNNKISIIGLCGGFFDAIGGGGWGPIVTSTLIGNGHDTRYTIGSVNLSEFFVTISEVLTFILFIKLTHWQVIVGLIIGGIIAAPLSAILCKKLPEKVLMRIVGITIILLSIRTIFLVF